MTTQPNWTKFDGSDEQIAELSRAKSGLCLKFEHSQETFVYKLKDISTTNGVVTLSKTVTHYLICNPHKHVNLISQWAMTGQPVWVKEGIDCMRPFIYETHNPDWNIPNTEYSFTPFEDVPMPR